MGMNITLTPDGGSKRKARFYNLIHFLSFVNGIEGDVIECGCWKGLSSFLMCNYLEAFDNNFNGNGYHIVDSFEGLSNPSKEDVITKSLVDKVGERKGKPFKMGGAYSAEMDKVKEVLKKYPQISFNKGWIPQILSNLPEKKYKFVHIDLDLYEPILSALEYFNLRLVKGGVIICDDYGSLFWPGAQQAVEEFSKKYNFQFIPLSSGQAIFMRL